MHLPYKSSNILLINYFCLIDLNIDVHSKKGKHCKHNHVNLIMARGFHCPLEERGSKDLNNIPWHENKHIVLPVETTCNQTANLKGQHFKWKSRQYCKQCKQQSLLLVY